MKKTSGDCSWKGKNFSNAFPSMIFNHKFLEDLNIYLFFLCITLKINDDLQIHLFAKKNIYIYNFN
jgi:hypothetical protein